MPNSLARVKEEEPHLALGTQLIAYNRARVALVLKNERKSTGQPHGKRFNRNVGQRRLILILTSEDS